MQHVLYYCCCRRDSLVVVRQRKPQQAAWILDFRRNHNNIFQRRLLLPDLDDTPSASRELCTRMYDTWYLLIFGMKRDAGEAGPPFPYNVATYLFTRDTPSGNLQLRLVRNTVTHALITHPPAHLPTYTPTPPAQPLSPTHSPFRPPTHPPSNLRSHPKTNATTD